MTCGSSLELIDIYVLSVWCVANIFSYIVHLLFCFCTCAYVFSGRSFRQIYQFFLFSVSEIESHLEKSFPFQNYILKHTIIFIRPLWFNIYAFNLSSIWVSVGYGGNVASEWPRFCQPGVSQTQPLLPPRLHEGVYATCHAHIWSLSLLLFYAQIRNRAQTVALALQAWTWT